MNYDLKTKSSLKINMGLYLVAVIFSILVLNLSSFYDYKRWAAQSVFVYGGAFVVTGLLYTVILFHRLTKEAKNSFPRSLYINQAITKVGSIVENFSFQFYFQVVLAFLVFVGVLIIPLTYNVVKLDQHTLPIGQNGAYVQPEVQVIEAAGKKLDHGKGPYVAPTKKYGTSVLAPPKPMPVNDYFAYLPGMSFFGLANSDEVPKPLTDARWYFTLFGLVSFLIAIILLDHGRLFKLSCFIALGLFPTATLTLATGGDDIPVIGLMVLVAVLLNRNQLILAGLTLGFAMSLKFTAWLMFIALIYTLFKMFSVKDVFKVLVSAGVVLAPILTLGIYNDVYGFITNAIRFPLGLAGTSSPADSALPGHLITSHFSHYKGLILLFLVAIFFLSCVAFLLKFPPNNISTMLIDVSFIMTTAILLAPNTRFGYLNYPVDLLILGIVLRFADGKNREKEILKSENVELTTV